MNGASLFSDCDSFRSQFHEECDRNDVRFESRKAEIQMRPAVVPRIEAESRWIEVKISVAQPNGHFVVQIHSNAGKTLPGKNEVRVRPVKADGTPRHGPVKPVCVEERRRATHT